MDRYTMFLNWKNQYCENDYTAQSNLLGSIKLGHAKNWTRFSAIPIKLPMVFFTELEQTISQFVWKHKRPWIAKAIYRFSTIPIKISKAFFMKLEQIILKFVWKHKRPWIDKTVLRKNKQSWGITLPDFRLYFKATAMHTVRHWQKKRYTDQRGRIEPRNNPHLQGQLVHEKGGKSIQQGKTASSIDGVEKTGQLLAKVQTALLHHAPE